MFQICCYQKSCVVQQLCVLFWRMHVSECIFSRSQDEHLLLSPFGHKKRSAKLLTLLDNLSALEVCHLHVLLKQRDCALSLDRSALDTRGSASAAAFPCRVLGRWFPLASSWCKSLMSHVCFAVWSLFRMDVVEWPCLFFLGGKRA